MRLTLHIPLLLSLTAFSLLAGAQAKIIPPANNDDMPGNTTIERKPFGTYYGYERMAAIYTPAELGGSGDVKLIGFYMNTTGSPAPSPAKIYLKHTSSSTMSGSDFSVESSGATVVFDGTISSFPNNSWIEVTVPVGTFSYDGVSNLEVLVESNGGGSGTEGSSDKAFRYHNAGGTMFQYWQADGSPPTGNGYTDTYRPNLKIDIGCLINVDLGTDTSICAGTSLTLDARHPGSQYKWNTTAASQTITVNQGGWYKVDVVTAAGCKGKDSIFVDVFPLAEIKGIGYTNTLNHYVFKCTEIFNVTDYLWDFGDGNTSTDPNPSHWYASAGAYTVKVVASNRCNAKQASMTINAPVGLPQLQYNENELRIYPNPATTDLFIDNKTGSPFQNITVFSSMGQQVMQATPDATSTETRLNISGLAHGMYLVRIVSDKGIISQPVMIK
jgi:hypothetical protein